MELYRKGTVEDGQGEGGWIVVGPQRGSKSQVHQPGKAARILLQGAVPGSWTVMNNIQAAHQT